MTYIDVTDDYDHDNAYGDIEPDARDYAGPSNYCPHGTYIGTPYGADYICGYCESDISVLEYRKMKAVMYERLNRHHEVKTEGLPLLARAIGRAYEPGDDIAFFTWLIEEANKATEDYIRSGK